MQAEFLRAAAFELWDVGPKMMSKLCSAGNGIRNLRMGETPPDPGFVAYAQSVALLLYGFAMENLIKALIVRKEPSLPSVDNGKIHWDVGGHDLLRLIEKAGVDLEPGERMIDERMILKTLTDWAVWQGRYPTPMKADSDSNKRFFPPKEPIEECFQRLSRILDGG